MKSFLSWVSLVMVSCPSNRQWLRGHQKQSKHASENFNCTLRNGGIMMSLYFRRRKNNVTLMGHEVQPRGWNLQALKNNWDLNLGRICYYILLVIQELILLLFRCWNSQIYTYRFVYFPCEIPSASLLVRCPSFNWKY